MRPQPRFFLPGERFKGKEYNDDDEDDDDGDYEDFVSKNMSKMISF